MEKMKRFNVKTEKRSVVLTVPLQTKEPVEIFILGYDPYSKNTEYFERRIEVDGNDSVNFNCPQTPSVMKIIAWSTGNKPFSISEITVNPFERNLKMLGDRAKDIEFIEKFSRRCGRFPARRSYKYKGADFKIQFLPIIRKDNGSKHPTPARIHTTLPVIQISKQHFDRMPIPQRVAILAHEYSHNYINRDQDSEMEADSNMVDLYKGLGYGKLEALTAFANVMSDTDTNYNRLMSIDRQL